VFVAENVSGLVKGSAKGYFKLILAALRDCGYRVEAKLLNAAWLGVPQARQRLIFVGVRADQGFDPVFPSPLPYQYSVRDVMPAAAVEPIEVDPETGREITFYQHAIYPFWLRLGRGESPKAKKFNLIKVDPDKPSPTIFAAGGNVGIPGPTHWDTPRKFTLLEVRRLCGFPDDFVLTGSYAKRWERLGRAVPPVMMSHIAASLRDELLACVPA
jgi:DNA (cytosine-5)-methyltransferase 1